MVRRLPAGPSRRHVVNAMLGSDFCATSPLSLVATRSTMRKPDGELLASNGETNRHDIVTVRLSARDPHARVIVATQAEHNIREARVKKKAVTRTTGMLIQQTYGRSLSSLCSHACYGLSPSCQIRVHACALARSGGFLRIDLVAFGTTRRSSA